MCKAFSYVTNVSGGVAPVAWVGSSTAGSVLGLTATQGTARLRQCFCGCLQGGAGYCACVDSPEKGVSSLHPCILWDPRGCFQLPPVLSPPQKVSCRGPSVPQEASCCGRGPTASLGRRGGLLLRLFPPAGPGIPRGPEARRHVPRRLLKRKRDVYKCASCHAKRELVPLV